MEVRTEPQGGEYGTTRLVDAATPLALPELDATLTVADFLPTAG